MTDFRPFEPRDIPWSAFGTAFGLFYGFMFVALVWFWGQGIILLLLLSIPFVAGQLVLNMAFDRFLKWRRRDDPPPPPTSWYRHHSISVGAALGACVALVAILWGNAR